MPARIHSQRETRDKAQGQTFTTAYRQWYESARWQRLRLELLPPDLYTCQETGVILSGRANAPDSPAVHHKVPHKDDEQMFWDIKNLEAVSKQWHDSEAQRQERSTTTL
jgi:5-methylcytosine-specific restriction endonuclease McrA